MNEQVARRALELMIGKTACMGDRYTQLAAIDFGKAHGCEDMARDVVRVARRSWMAWQASTQREWQAKIARRPGSYVRHHDSRATREKFVRGK